MNIEDLQSELLTIAEYDNPFWFACRAQYNIDPRILYGMAIENYHFLSRQRWFDTPALRYPGSDQARLLLDQFYSENYGRDETILSGLEEIGITREQLLAAHPLPQTIGLCHGLSHWAATDPIFFFTIPGVLERRDARIYNYINTMPLEAGINHRAIAPLITHTRLSNQGEYGHFTRQLFRELPPVSMHDFKQLRKNTRLFIELYDDFHAASWRYYSTASNPVFRKIVS